MAEIFNFNLKVEDYLDLADQSFRATDIEKSVVYVGKALEIEPENVEAMLFLASIYSDLGSYELSNKILFKAYVYAKSDLQKTSAVATLVNNFYELGDNEAAEFYLNAISSKWEKFEEMTNMEVVGDIDEDEDDDEEDFTLAYPKTEEFYFEALERAHQFLQERDFDSTLKELEVFSERTPLYDASNHIRLVCYLLKDDIDRVIYEATEMLKKSNYLPIRCTLVTAYMIEEKNDIALKLLDEILTKDYNGVEEITVLLPLLVNFEMHAEVVKYTKRLLDLSDLQPQTMMWLSQGLYNLGQKTEAAKIMRRVATIYREFTAANFYLDYYAKQPENVNYCLGLPLIELIDRQNKLRSFIELDCEECTKALTYDKKISELVKWCFRDVDGKSLLLLVDKLNNCWSSQVENIYIDALITKDVDLKLGSTIIEGFLRHKSALDYFITIDGKCKEIHMRVPDALSKLPSNFIRAISTAVFETLVNLDNANESLDRLSEYVDSFCTLNERGNLEWLIVRGDKAAKFKSTRTLLGIFVLKSAFADENEIESVCDFYEISPTTFKKYLKILNGETK
ncbi:MAG: hypothetical protein PHE93_05135 [Clostridia bacterium]|nr:hypothetical protein [Clostridia bacterium]